jgi:hypothetical protein
MYVFAATFWTLDVAFFVFRKRKNYFKWLLAIFAVELIARHGDLRKNARAAGSGLLNLWCTLQNRWRQGKRLSGRRSVSGNRVNQALTVACNCSVVSGERSRPQRLKVRRVFAIPGTFPNFDKALQLPRGRNCCDTQGIHPLSGRALVEEDIVCVP